MAVLVVGLLLFLALAGFSDALYCVCNSGLSDSVYQKNIDYACGNGADCSQINQNGACYNPNTVKDHCNYAVNSYYQKKSTMPGSCDFSGTATTTPTPPTTSGSSCVFPSGPSNGGSTTPTPTTPGTPAAGGTPTTPVGGTPTTPVGGTPTTPVGGTPTTPGTPSMGGTPSTPGAFPGSGTPSTPGTVPGSPTTPGFGMGPTGSGFGSTDSGSPSSKLLPQRSFVALLSMISVILISAVI